MKIFVVFGFILLAVIFGISLIFSQAMYSSIGLESNNTTSAENKTVIQYEINYGWEVFIAVLAVIFAVGAALWLFFIL